MGGFDRGKKDLAKPPGSLSSCKGAGRILLLPAGLAAAGFQLVALGSDVILERDHLHLNRSQIKVNQLHTCRFAENIMWPCIGGQ